MSRLIKALLGVTLALAGCEDDLRTHAQLDGPVDVAVLPPGSFYEVPVAFVSNMRSGRVTKLDLKRKILLVEDGPAPWMAGPDLAFGLDRVLSEITVVERADSVDVWVADDGRGELLRRSYIAGRTDSGAPQWSRAGLVGDPRCLDAAGGAVDCPVELRSLWYGEGRITDETWTLTWEGHSWAVAGSASGPQANRAVPGTPYRSDRDELSFTPALAGAEPELGSRLELDTEVGVEVADAGGLVTDLVTVGDQVFALVVPDQGPGFLSVWDGPGFFELGRVELPLGAVPERLEAGRDEGVLWIADSAEVPGGGRVLRVDHVPGDIDTLAVSEWPAPEPLIDVAESRDPEAHRLFAGAAYSDAVWMLDAETGAWLDANPFTEEVDPTHVGGLISGMSASNDAIPTWDLDEDGTRLESWGIFVTTFAAEMAWIDPATGCQVFSTPTRAFLDTPVDSLFSDVGWESNPGIVADDGSGGLVSISTCGGLARSESWRFTYSEVEQSYEVEGSQSGVQQGRAYEGVRYTTDGGEMSVLIMPGTLPTTEGDRWSFAIDDGVSPIPTQELPGDPLIYTERYDDRTGSWWKLKERQIAVIPHTGNDLVLAIDIAGQGVGGLRVFQ